MSDLTRSDRRPTPGYLYGQMLGSMHRAFEDMARAIVTGFAAGRRPSSELTLEDRELRREAAYRRRIAREREIGLQFVRSEAQRVRREIGLPDGRDRR